MRSVGVVGRFTALSRIFGLFRDQLMAHHFGASLAVSAFYIAFRIPNLARRLFGEGALSSAFVPVFADCLEKEGKTAAADLGARVSGFLVTALGVLTALAWMAARLLENRLEAGGRWATVLPLLRVMLPYAPLICLAALLMAMLNSLRRFALPALVPVLLNLVWIAAILLSRRLAGEHELHRLHLLAWAVVLAGVLQMSAQIPSLYRAGLARWPRFDFAGHPGLQRVLRLMAPAAFGMGVIQINVFLDSILAMIAAPWAPAALFYAERLVYLPLGLFATALGTVLLPTYSRQQAQADQGGLRETMDHALLSVVILMTPAAVLLLVLSTPAVGLLFSWRGGQFGALEITRTARALACYAPGLLVFSLYKVLTPAFYARQDVRTPVGVAIRGVLFNLVMNIIVVFAWPEEWRHAGLALSTVIASAFNCFCLWRRLPGEFTGSPRRRFGAAVTGVIVMSAVMGLAVHFLAGFMPSLVAPGLWGGKAGQLVALAGGGGVGVGLYLAGVLWFCQPAREIIGDVWRSWR